MAKHCGTSGSQKVGAVDGGAQAKTPASDKSAKKNVKKSKPAKK